MKKNLLLVLLQNIFYLKYILVLGLVFIFSPNAFGGKSCSSYKTQTTCNATTTCAWDSASSACVVSSAPIGNARAVDLLIAKTPSARVVDVNQTITYILTIANESRYDATSDNNISVTDTLPQVSGLADFRIINNGGFTCTIDGATITAGMPLTTNSILTCKGGGVSGRTGNSGVPGLNEIWYSFRAPGYNTELNNTVSVSAINDSEYNGKESYAIVYVYNGNLSLNPPPPEHADIIDTYTNNTEYNNGTSKVIKTKITAKTFTPITAVHLDGNNLAVPFTHPDPDMSFIVIPYMSDNSCITQEPIIDSNTGKPLILNIRKGDTAAIGNMTLPSYAKRSSRILISYIDLGAILDDTGVKCVYTSSDRGNIAGLGQCINNANNYYDAFGLSAYERCNVLNGRPCDSSNGGYSCGKGATNCTGYNPLYDNELGCLMCTLNAFPECSTDNFAIRPKKFDINATHQNFPNLLRAGGDYNVSLTALDAANNPTSQYTIASYPFNNDLNASAKKYFKNNTLDATNLLHGKLDSDDTQTAYMVNGFSSSSTSQPAASQEIINISYDDVGKITLHMQDQNWSAIDNDDTPMNCDENGTYICGDRNVTIIPHHFAFAELNITNHSGPDGNFTYIADNRGMPSATQPTRSPMAARVQTRIEALNKDNNITQNFRAGPLYYENNISVSPIVAVTPDIPDANESNITNQLIGFGEDGSNSDENGTRTVKWDESTYPLEFNFQRKINEPANPFDVNGSYLSISMLSRYVDPLNSAKIADINGSRIGDQNGSTACATDPGCEELNAENNATFYYARSRSSQFFYDDITDDNVATPILIDVYCDLGFTTCANFGINTIEGQTNEYKWWLSLGHNTSNNDGNITLLINPAGSAIISASSTSTEDPAEVRITSGGIDQTVTVTATADRPLTVEIDLDETNPTDTNHWLIYNPDDAILPPTPFYKVRFIGTSGWAGHGDTGHVVDSNVSTKKNNRMGW
ncbi:hypothetical protein [Sulfurovum sp.]|uniref:hypothetical protein n=1 Tax=Sulfurovum sp. TaxID=1969726 RepID=UPI002867BF5A|nr:hypothetical protein [Sulfurovum sp.]